MGFVDTNKGPASNVSNLSVLSSNEEETTTSIEEDSQVNETPELVESSELIPNETSQRNVVSSAKTKMATGK